MNFARTLFAAASLAALATSPAVAQHGGSHGGGGGGYHGGGYGGYGGYRGGYGYRGWYGGDAFAFGLLGGYALSSPWGWGYGYYPGDYYYDDAPPPPPPSYSYSYDTAPPQAYDGPSPSRASQGAPGNDQHCPLYWNSASGRYEPHCN